MYKITPPALQSAILTGLRMLAGLIASFVLIAGFVQKRDLAGLIAYVQTNDFAVVCGSLIFCATSIYEVLKAYRTRKTLDDNGLKVNCSPTIPPAILPLLALVSLGVGLAGCASVPGGQTVRLNVNRAFLAAQIGFMTSQQTVLVLCSAPTKPVDACNKAVDILAKGADAERVGFAAQQAGNAAWLATALQTLVSVPSDLVALGVLKAN